MIRKILPCPVCGDLVECYTDNEGFHNIPIAKCKRCGTPLTLETRTIEVLEKVEDYDDLPF